MDFKTTTIRQIKIWVWAATVLPITALAAMFFIWRFSPETFIGYAFVASEIAMFTIAVIWWWWAMYTMRNLVRQWDETRDRVKDVSTDIKEIRSAIFETLKKDK
jgi:hypothetical protein